MQLGVMLSRSDVLMAQPLCQFVDTEALGRVVQGASNCCPCAVTRNFADRILERNVGLGAEQRNHVPVHVLPCDSYPTEREEKVDHLIGLGVESKSLRGPHALPGFDSLGHEPVHRLSKG